MRRDCLVFAVVAGLLCVAPGSAHAANQYGWTISNNEVSPLSNTGTATFAVRTFYLWFHCSQGDGMTAAEFDLAADGISHFGTTPQNGFLNAGGTNDLRLAVGACPDGFVVAATLIVLDLPGSMCFVPSADNGVLGTMDCAQSPLLWDADWIGYTSSGGVACQGGLMCESTLVRSSWARVKGLYRTEPRRTELAPESGPRGL